MSDFADAVAAWCGLLEVHSAHDECSGVVSVREYPADMSDADIYQAHAEERRTTAEGGSS